MTTNELLRSYAFGRSEAAFAELVQRHINLVYSAALRQVGGDSATAQDVTQAVFTELARNATRLVRHTALTGWLYTTTRFLAAKARRAEKRRHAREQEAHIMNQLLSPAEPDPVWQQLQPLLDEVMHELKAADRDAVLMRYFERLPLAEVGARLGVSENTARMRLDRALDKLRGALVKRGVTCSAVTLATILAEKTVHAVPAGVAEFVRANALEAAQAVGAPSILATLLSSLAKAKLNTAPLYGLGLLLVVVFALHLHNASRGTPREPPKTETTVNNQPETAATAIKSTWSVHSRTPATPEDPVLVVALDKLRQLLYAPTIERVYPSRDLTAVLDQLGAETNQMLQVLVEALQESDLQKKLHYVPRTRAICSLGYLGTKAEAALPALMELIHTKDAAGRDTAISSALPVIRPVPELAQELMDIFKTDAVVVRIASGYPAGYQGQKTTVHDPGMGRAVTEAIARLMNEHRDMAPDVDGILVSNLNDSDGDVRVLAASTLLHPSVRNVVPQQYQTAALQRLISSLKDRDPYHPQALRWRYQTALLALGNCQPTAESAVPALTEFIATQTNLDFQRMAGASLASVTSAPSVQITSSRQESGEELAREVNSGSKSVADLAKLLNDPKTRVQAARALDMLGPKASEALPALQAGIKSEDAAFQELVAAVIKTLDPASPKPLLTSDELTPAMHAISDQLASSDPSTRDSLQQEINQELRKHIVSIAQVSAFADKLGAVDPQLRQTFVAKLLEFDPALRTKLIRAK
jgi:RNA polymerase sigma factor (sigma-70 family)